MLQHQHSQSPVSVADTMSRSYSNSSDLEHSKSSFKESSSMKSQSIPMSSKHIPRTPSEVQLCMDEAIAEQRDFAFFSRLVKGISDTQRQSHDTYLRLENENCLSHIVRTRQGLNMNNHMKQLPMSSRPTPASNRDKNAMYDFITSNAIAVAEDEWDDNDEGIFDIDM